MADDLNPRAVIGANGPPDESAFAGFHAHIGDLFDEAKNFLDGQGVNSDAESEAVAKLMDAIRTAAKDADKARAAEKKPHADAAKAVDTKWKPLLDRAELAVDACKKALAPWLAKKAHEQRELAEQARQEAAAKAKAAAEAMRTTTLDDLAGREQAEALVADAKRADADATKAEKARPQAAGGSRAATLRTSYRPELTNAGEALRHYVKTRPDELKACLLHLAEVDVRNGARSLPGFIIHAEQTVV
jgi:hypothetical protein